MEIIKFNNHIPLSDMETVVNIGNTTISVKKKDRVAYVETTFPGEYKSLVRKHWEEVTRYVDDDGNILGGVFKAPAKNVTFKDPTKVRVISDEQREASRLRLMQIRKMANGGANVDEDEDPDDERDDEDEEDED